MVVADRRLHICRSNEALLGNKNGPAQGPLCVQTNITRLDKALRRVVPHGPEGTIVTISLYHQLRHDDVFYAQPAQLIATKRPPEAEQNQRLVTRGATSPPAADATPESPSAYRAPERFWWGR